MTLKNQAKYSIQGWWIDIIAITPIMIATFYVKIDEDKNELKAMQYLTL